MSKNEILVAKSLSKSYGSVTALYPTTLSIAKGDILGLVGKNGAGKTTLLKLITGQSLPTSGELELFSAVMPEGLRQARQRIGAIVETPSFYRDLTARQNLEYYRIQRGIPGKDVVDVVLGEVGLSDTGRKKFKDFSLGMKQRLGLALALMNHPDFLVLDEPINGLDPMGIVEIRELLLTLNREKHITMLISCHVLAEMQNLATAYAFIDSGKIIKTMTAKQLEENCNPYLRLVVDAENRVAALLEQHFEGIHYSIQPDLSIHIYNLPGRADEVNQVLVHNNIRLSSLETRGTNLEDYFVSLVGRETDG
ncbi:bacitracin ABC transporter ATP-binding protein [Paenibacillus riograndensis]|uniref:Bacitracin ABC transporter ATP-binding protein n=1 Tax=Paenibacillus riograndensis TaxID=483937 RepID=A0A132TZQ5_9BACL|nr:ABC transporter ATP-binding protein [Paenibacillus riograndensis]KWX76782.1 bacitracin ABC transporter ATP-binding protein [Paenibacillus riograndensis]